MGAATVTTFAVAMAVRTEGARLEEPQPPPLSALGVDRSASGYPEQRATSGVLLAATVPTSDEGAASAGDAPPSPSPAGPSPAPSLPPALPEALTAPPDVPDSEGQPAGPEVPAPAAAAAAEPGPAPPPFSAAGLDDEPLTRSSFDDEDLVDDHPVPDDGPITSSSFDDEDRVDYHPVP